MERVTRLFKKDFAQSENVYLIAGLGNPGREYRYTRHNVGFMVVDGLAEHLNIPLSRVQSKAIIGQGKLGASKVILAKPQTFMNLSGQAIAGLMRFYKIPTSQLLVIHDDLDLPFGTLRLRPGGGSAGQKGLGSTIQQLGTQDFPRLRIGIGRPPGRMNAADYVLQEFGNGDQETLKFVMDFATRAAVTFVEEGLEYAMNHFNGTAGGE